jgi:hypothetical protein
VGHDRLPQTSQGDDAGHSRDHHVSMNIPPNQPPSSPVIPMLARQEHLAREVERLRAIGLRTAIGQELDYRGIVDPATIGAVLKLPALEAERLLKRYQWREGDVALLEAVAVRLGLQVPSL